MPRKSKSLKKRGTVLRVNTSELALVFSIAITLFVATVMTGGLKLTTQTKAKVTVVEGAVGICGQCSTLTGLKHLAEYKCAPGLTCIPAHDGQQVISKCRCIEKNKDGSFKNEKCNELDKGKNIEVIDVDGTLRSVQAKDGCWKRPVGGFEIPGYPQKP